MSTEFIYNPPLEPWLDILFHDEDVIVVNKPSGLLSVPGRLPQYHDSVLARVRTLYPQAFAVHRLDLGTSGVLAVGLHKASISALGRQFMQRQVKKVYIAWCAGIIDKPGTIDLPLRLDVDHRPYQIVDFVQGRRAFTKYEPLMTKGDRTLVRLFPRTGRSHQLRVHLKEIGHPILGDHLYAPPEIFKAAPHLMLHAACLEFHHPTSGKLLRFAANPPFAVPAEFTPEENWLELCPEELQV